MNLGTQILWLLILALPIASIAWTVTHEEVFREPREYCNERSRRAQHLPSRKFFYVLTCEYCLAHYVVICARLPASHWYGWPIFTWVSLAACGSISSANG